MQRERLGNVDRTSVSDGPVFLEQAHLFYLPLPLYGKVLNSPFKVLNSTM